MGQARDETQRHHQSAQRFLKKVVDKSLWVCHNINMMKRDVHFVGFRGDEYRSAVKVWGKPDFFHRVFDDRVIFGGEVGDDDIIIFANGADKRYKKFTFNDSAVF